MKPTLYRKFSKFSIFFTEDAIETLKSHSDNQERKHQSCLASLLSRLEQYGNTGELHTPDQLNSEGYGFWAIKARCGLRAYFWFQGKGTIIVSHFKLKKSDKLEDADKKKMEKNQNNLQEWKNV